MIIVRPAPPACGTQNSDEALSQRLRDALEQQPWFSNGNAQVLVVDGVVTIGGFLADDAFGQALCAAVCSVAGAGSVRNELIRIGTVSGCALATG